MQAIWKGKVLADSSDMVVIEGNHYFPPKDVNMKLLKKNRFHSLCYWKGLASYYDAVDGDSKEKNIGWYYPRATWFSKKIVGKDFSNHVAFWGSVELK